MTFIRHESVAWRLFWYLILLNLTLKQQQNLRAILDWYLDRKDYDVEDLRFRNSCQLVMEDEFFRQAILKNLPTRWSEWPNNLFQF